MLGSNMPVRKISKDCINLEAGEGRHEELCLARVLREEADGRPHVHPSRSDLKHCPPFLCSAAVHAGGVLRGCCGQEAVLHCAHRQHRPSCQLPKTHLVVCAIVAIVSLTCWLGDILHCAHRQHRPSCQLPKTHLVVCLSCPSRVGLETCS